jgi:hypothetical protein
MKIFDSVSQPKSQPIGILISRQSPHSSLPVSWLAIPTIGDGIYDTLNIESFCNTHVKTSNVSGGIISMHANGEVTTDRF